MVNYIQINNYVDGYLILEGQKNKRNAGREMQKEIVKVCLRLMV
jgi:hypothetical protein